MQVKTMRLNYGKKDKKKLLIITTFLIGANTTFFLSYSNAQNGIYYSGKDYCGYYILGCQSVVTKCRERGTDYCAIFEQIPCEESCNMTIAP